MRRAALALCLVSSTAAAAPTADVVAQCSSPDATEGAAPPRDKLTLTAAKFADVPGWADDKLAEAVPSFLKSCAKLDGLKDTEAVGVDGHGGLAKQWRKACAAAAKVPAGDDAAARAMFEAEFAAWVAAGKAGTTGKLTGYDDQEMHGSRKKHDKYTVAVLARPDDLVTLDLGKFTSDGHGRHLWGRLDKDGELQPYYTRQEIRTGALASKKLELLYVNDPVDLIFAQIEGSAKVVMDDGTTVWLNFAGKNGRAYKGIGAALRGAGGLPKGTGTMQNIRKWFTENPTRYDEIVDQDASYVFFKESPEPGAVGTQKTILTARRSIAVDRAFIAMSTPVWVETRVPKIGLSETYLWHQLLIAQDTGGGILGAVRGDVYWGDDAEANELGGRMGGPGKFWLLLPRGVTK